MPSSALAVESSTVSHARMAALGEAAAAHGRHLIDAPVLGSRPQADAGQLVHLIGGLARDVAVAAPAFAALSSAQLHVGPLGSGTALKLAANALLGIQVAAVAELLARTQRLGLDPVRAVDLLGQTPVLGLAAKGAAALMLAGKDAPLFPVDLVAKDFGYAIDDPATMPIAAAAARVFDAASAAGLAARNLTAVATLY